jgi:hypothetical protein
MTRTDLLWIAFAELVSLALMLIAWTLVAVLGTYLFPAS